MDLLQWIVVAPSSDQFYEYDSLPSITMYTKTKTKSETIKIAIVRLTTWVCTASEVSVLWVISELSVSDI